MPSPGGGRRSKRKKECAAAGTRRSLEIEQAEKGYKKAKCKEEKKAEERNTEFLAGLGKERGN